MQKKYKKALSLFLFVISGGVLSLFFINAGNNQPTPAGVNFNSIALNSTKKFFDLELAVNKGGGYFDQFIAQNNLQSDFDSDWRRVVANDLGGSGTPENINLAKKAVRTEFIMTSPALRNYYLVSLADELRVELSRFGFIVEPAGVGSDINIKITGARGPASMTAMGIEVNRTISKFGYKILIDPLRSLNPQSAGFYRTPAKDLSVNVRHFLSADLIATDTPLMGTLRHELSHANSYYRKINGIRDLNAGRVDATVARKYPGHLYTKPEGFSTDEPVAHRLNAPSGDPLGYAQGHALTAATLEAKLEIYDKFVNGLLQVDSAKMLAEGNPKHPAFDFKGSILYLDAGLGGSIKVPTSYVHIADIEPQNLTAAEVRKFLLQSIGKNIAALEFYSRRLSELYTLSQKPGAKYTTAEVQAAISLTERHVGVIEPRMRSNFGPFGAMLGTPANVLTLAESPITRFIESRFGTNSYSLKVAGFEVLGNLIRSTGATFNSPNNFNGTAPNLTPEATAKLTHIDRVMNHDMTGETWTDSEVNGMPSAEKSRNRLNALYGSVKLAGPYSFLMMSYDAYQALIVGDNYSEFVDGLVFGYLEFQVVSTVARTAAKFFLGGAAVNPAGAVVILGYTLNDMVNRTIQNISDDNYMKFYNWVTQSAPHVGVQLSQYALAASQVNSRTFYNAIESFPIIERFPDRSVQSRIITATSGVGNSPESVVEELSNQLGLRLVDLDPTPYTNWNFEKTNSPGYNDGTIAEGVASIQSTRPIVQIKLRFICSQWLYLTNHSPTRYPGNWINAETKQYNDDVEIAKIQNKNIEACNNKAVEITAFVRRVFSNSQIPVNFIFSYEMEPSKDWLKLTPFLSSATKPGTVIGQINESSAMKAIQIRTSNYVPASWGVSCNPFIPPSKTCDPKSTTIVDNFTLHFGVQNWVNNCGGYNCSKTEDYKPSTLPSAPVCFTDCRCIILAPDENLWNTWNKGSCVKGYGRWTGVGSSSSGMNCSGCAIINETPTPYWPSQYVVAPLKSARDWLKTNYPIPNDEWTVAIAVTPYGSASSLNGFENNSEASSSAIYDALSNKALTDQGTIHNAATPSNFFSQFGYMSVSATSPVASQALAHQLGHLFGGLHERTAWPSTTFFNSANTNLINREAAAGIFSGRKSIMMSELSSDMEPQFTSSIEMPNQPYILGDQNTNNRNQILRTMMFLSQNQTVERPTTVEAAQSVSTTTASSIPAPVLYTIGGPQFAFSANAYIFIFVGNSGGPIQNCSLSPNSPSLPAGLYVNPADCSVSGISAEKIPMTDFKLVATNAAGQTGELVIGLSLSDLEAIPQIRCNVTAIPVGGVLTCTISSARADTQCKVTGAVSVLQGPCTAQGWTFSSDTGMMAISGPANAAWIGTSTFNAINSLNQSTSFNVTILEAIPQISCNVSSVAVGGILSCKITSATANTQCKVTGAVNVAQSLCTAQGWAFSSETNTLTISGPANAAWIGASTFSAINSANQSTSYNVTILEQQSIPQISCNVSSIAVGGLLSCKITSARSDTQCKVTGAVNVPQSLCTSQGWTYSSATNTLTISGPANAAWIGTSAFNAINAANQSTAFAVTIVEAVPQIRCNVSSVAVGGALSCTITSALASTQCKVTGAVNVPQSLCTSQGWTYSSATNSLSISGVANVAWVGTSAFNAINSANESTFFSVTILPAAKATSLKR